MIKSYGNYILDRPTSSSVIASIAKNIPKTTSTPFGVSLIPRRFRSVVDVLLSSDPGNPTIERKRILINRLASITSRTQVQFTSEDGVDLWKIERIKK